jgi:LysW-gamma-L-lysine carboxypeptidase
MSDASVAGDEGATDADTEARDLLERLVAIPSPSGEEGACAAALAEFLREHDREAYLDEVGNVRAPADDGVLLTSHVDTVPGDIPVRVEEDEAEGPVLWGRGSVDAKGPLAAMAVAAVRTGASFVGVVGEERNSRGARFLIEDREAPEAVVNGEPSGTDGITLGYRGILSGTYLATSESGHTSRPENNAIQDAMDWWSRAVEAFEPDDEWEPVFERVTPKPTRFEGGPSEDGLSVEATMDVSFRVPPSMTVEEVREVADGELDPEVGTVNWKDSVRPTMQSPRTEVARAFRVAIRGQGLEPRLVRKTGTADMNIFAGEWDCPMVTYGPGDSDLDHAPDERLPLRELDRAVAVLADAAGRLL